MPKTKISDVIVPEVYTPYLIRRTMELSRLIQSGVAVQNERLNTLVTGGGKLINMPYWNSLTGEEEILSDTTPLTPDKITAGADVAALLIRGKAWSANELAGALAGSDPMAAIGTQTARWRIIREQKVLISILNGIFADAISSHVNDISGLSGDAANISAAAILDTKQLLGDASDQLVAMAVHSATFTSLQKQNLIAYIPDSEGRITIPTYLGYQLIVDDGCPVNEDVFTSYLMGSGAFGRGEGVPVSLTPVETDRDSLQSDDILINRWAYILHPFGIKFTNTTVAGETPSNAELALAANWQLVYEHKAIALAELKHKVA
jgi:hypothetical protein